jgi:hypothetical protein
VDIRLDSLESARSRDVWGWVGVGVGAAALGAGVVLHLVRDDPDRYEPKSDLFARARWIPTAWAGGGGGGGGLGAAGIF